MFSISAFAFHVAVFLKGRNIATRWRIAKLKVQTAMGHLSGELKTFDEVVEVLGGKREVARLLDQNTAAVCNWKRRRERFPTKYYLEMAKALKKKRASASDDLWGFYKSAKPGGCC